MRGEESGISLVGLLISTGLGSLLLLTLSGFWLQSRADLQRGEAGARLQDSGRYVLGLLQRELALAGYAAGLPAARVAGRGWVSDDCGDGIDWALSADATLDVALAPGNPPVTVNGHRLGCLQAAEVQPDSALLVLRRSSAEPVSEPAADRHWYLRLHAPSASADWFYLAGGESLPAEDASSGPAVSYWGWHTAIYYLRSWSQQPSDGIPTLCVERLLGERMLTDCLAEGVEQWSLEFGLDSDRDGIVDIYRDVPTGAQLRQTRLLRVYLLLRSVERVPGQHRPRTFQLGQRSLQRGADGYLRQVVALTMPLNNLALQRSLEWQP